MRRFFPFAAGSPALPALLCLLLAVSCTTSRKAQQLNEQQLEKVAEITSRGGRSSS